MRCWKRQVNNALQTFCKVALLLAAIAFVNAAVAAEPNITILETLHYPEYSEISAAFDLVEEQEEALRNGVMLTFSWRYQFVESRAWLWDKVLAEFTGRRRLIYRAFTKQYVVEDLPADKRTVFPTLADALDGLSRFALPTLVGDQPTSPARRFRIWLDIGELPPPLRLPAHLSAQWQLDSDWHNWDAPGEAGYDEAQSTGQVGG